MARVITVKVKVEGGIFIDLPVEVVVHRPDFSGHQHARVRLGTMYPRLRSLITEDERWDHSPMREIAERALNTIGYTIAPKPPMVNVEWWCPVEYISSGRSAYRWDWAIDAPVERARDDAGKWVGADALI